jgi:hypothetical protein
MATRMRANHALSSRLGWAHHVLGVVLRKDCARSGHRKARREDKRVALGSDAVSKQYGLDELPVTIVFDGSGKQVKRFEGFTAEDALWAVVQQSL